MNIKERKNKTDAFKEHGKEDKGSSYFGDFSNIVRLYDGYDSTESIYIEGIGTEDKKEDVQSGYAFGYGHTGIRAKVKKGHDKIIKKCTRILEDNNNVGSISTLTIDVYGFSRGAAAARNFVAEITYPAYNPIKKGEGRKTYYANRFNELVPNKKIPRHGYFGEEIEKQILKIDQIKIRFLGIYDTVSSFHPNFSATPNFRNDVNELKLNDTSKAKKVVHFVATDEHRKNFPLTHVSGFERTFPGVHSDIGGGYLDGEETFEKEQIGKEVVDEIETYWGLNIDSSNLTELKKKLITDGWYTDTEISIKKKRGEFYRKLTGVRTLKNTYSYIPLHFMAQLSKKYGSKINVSLLENRSYSINDDKLLVRVKKRLKSYVFEGGRPYIFKKLMNAQGDELQEQIDLRKLRNKYLHWSSDKDGLGMDPDKNRERHHIYK